MSSLERSNQSSLSVPPADYTLNAHDTLHTLHDVDHTNVWQPPMYQEG